MSEYEPRRRPSGSAKPGTSLPTSTGQNIENLKNTISFLHSEVVHCKAETQKITDQLNCLITLVKRAWTGDKSAAIHVATIVGVAPPDYNEISEHQVSVVPKSRALNNWALLTIGLLNKEYKKLEYKVQTEQRRYLSSRQAYLDEQLLYDKDVQTKNKMQLASRPTSGKRPDSAIQKVDCGVRKKTDRSLYRKASGPSSLATNLTWGDVVPSPLNDTSQKTNNDTSSFRGGSIETNLSQKRNYSDPSNYATAGLFDSNKIVETTRPISSAKQRASDVLRARPKSSVLPKGQRPLKYETTRPLSAQVAGKASRALADRPLSSTTRNKVFITLSRDCDIDETNGLTEADESATLSSQGDCETPKNKKTKPVSSQKVRRPEHVDAFVEDLKSMKNMETDFKDKLASLQKKLGITEGIL